MSPVRGGDIDPGDGLFVDLAAAYRPVKKILETPRQRPCVFGSAEQHYIRSLNLPPKFRHWFRNDVTVEIGVEGRQIG
jgi:hypothetical protein